MKKKLAFVGLFVSSAAVAAPEITDVVMSQPGGTGRPVEITYTLSGAPAVVWLDIQTNGPSGWASIGVEAIYGDGFSAGSPSGDANVVVTEDGARKISWNPRRTWPGRSIPAGGARAVLTAVSADNAPQYLAVDLASGQHRFFPSAEAVPGGVMDESWRRTRMLFRRCPAHGVTWTSGTGPLDGDAPTMNTVTFPNDFYAAVFETTQAQWRMICPAGEGLQPYVDGDKVPEGVDQNLIPMDRVSMTYARECNALANLTNKDGDENYMYPAPPNPLSFLGRMRTLTQCAAFPDGIDFDLPGEVMWRYACQAGNDFMHWGNGTYIVHGQEVSQMPGRCMNGNNDVKEIAECGSYEPNDWGLYDMHGNLFELCLDWFVTSPRGFSGLVNANGPKAASDAAYVVSGRVRCGGWYGEDDTIARGCSRNSGGSDARGSSVAPWYGDARVGIRVFCRAGLR